MAASLTIYQGTNFGPQPINVVDAAGAAVDLTGWSVYAHARKGKADAIAFDLFPEITDEAAGTIEIAPTKAQSAQYPVGTYTWDLILQNPAGDLIPYLAKSTITVAKTATELPA